MGRRKPLKIFVWNGSLFSVPKRRLEWLAWVEVLRRFPCSLPLLVSEQQSKMGH